MSQPESPSSLKHVWPSIDAEDYRQHMINTGQASVNAAFTERWLQEIPATDVLFAGAGPGQMLSFLAPQTLARHSSVTFTDVHPGFLEQLELKLSAGQKALLDDIENTKLSGPFKAVIVVLVLEHVEWRLALASFQRWQAERILIVIQENPA
jgi:2-polyprenyl-3-methyl-5-hydroxy-6-metoxy-1,4-benzoquinol methylase